MKSIVRISILCAAAVSLAAVLWVAAEHGRAETKLTYSEFLERVQAGQVSSVIIASRNSGTAEATYRLKDGAMARTMLPPNFRDALRTMQDERVNVEIQDSSFGLLPFFINASPFFLLLAVWIFLMLRKFPNGPWARI